ncbi:MAG: hypothetical protein J2P22_17640, partial [Nocardioides sp.]|nr:hypothetical protein [Nocardioides sp.]
MRQGRVRPTADVLAVTVHGPGGALDLVVPSGVAVIDVAREYAAQAGLTAIPLLHSRAGRSLLASASLAELGVDTGDILVATAGVHRAAPASSSSGPRRQEGAGTGPLAVLWCAIAAGVAVFAGWCAANALS